MNKGELLLHVIGDGATATAVATSTLEAAGLLERQHLQEWIVAHPEILGVGVKIVAIEYNAWVAGADAQRDRLDILGLDPDGRLVVAELKRGHAPDTVEMQAIKYAAMASRFRPESLAGAHSNFLSQRGTSITTEQALEALLAHADALSEETLANPRICIVAQGFPPSVISSVVWMSDRGIDISLVRFQPYKTHDDSVFVTFSQLYPLLDLADSIVAPGTPTARVPVNQLPVVEWSVADLVELGRIANVTTRTVLELCADRPEQTVSLTQVIEAAQVTRPAARGQLAGLTMVMKSRFGRRNWPFSVVWNADGSQQAFYRMNAPTAVNWLAAAAELDVEQSEATSA